MVALGLFFYGEMISSMSDDHKLELFIQQNSSPPVPFKRCKARKQMSPEPAPVVAYLCHRLQQQIKFYFGG